MLLYSADFRFLKMFARRTRRKLGLRSSILFESPKVMQRPRFDSSLHFDRRKIQHIRTEKSNASTRRLLVAVISECWPQVCRVKITSELLLTICFVSTTTNSMKCLVNWIPLNTHVRFEQNPPDFIQQSNTHTKWDRLYVVNWNKRVKLSLLLSTTAGLLRIRGSWSSGSGPPRRGPSSKTKKKFTVCLCFCSSSPFLGPWKVTGWNLSVFCCARAASGDKIRLHFWNKHQKIDLVFMQLVRYTVSHARM